MMQCPYCGNEVKEGWKFCVKCAKRLPDENGNVPGIMMQLDIPANDINPKSKINVVSMFMSIFSFKGRISRLQYIIRIVVLSVLMAFFLVLCRYGFYVLHIYWMRALSSILVLLSIIVLYANMTKRFHDFGKTGKWIIPSIIVNILSLVYESSTFQFLTLPYLILFFMKGDPFTNRYGEPPQKFVTNDDLANTLQDPTIKNNKSANILSLLFSKNINIAKIIAIVFLLLIIQSSFAWYGGILGYLRLDSDGIFTLLRIVVTIFSMWIAYDYKSKNIMLGVWLFGFLAILFNPIFEMHFSENTWITFDVWAVFVFSTSLYHEYKNISSNQ